VIGALSVMGFYRLFARLNRRKVAILFYHGVSARKSFDGISNYQGKHIRLSRFRAHLRFLARRYRVMPLPEVIDALRTGKPLPHYTAVITFDDGYENNATVALPALKSEGLTAAFFLTSSLIASDRCLWVDEIEQVLAATDRAEVVVRTEKGEERLPLSTEDARRAADRRMREIGKRLPDAEKRRWLAEFYERNRIDPPKASGDYRFMGWSQVRDLRAAGMTIGSHTVTHAIVTRLEPEEMEREVGEARKACETALGEKCETFAYPNGRAGDFDGKTTALLRELGFSCGLTTVHGLVAPGDDLYTLNRMGVGDATTLFDLEAQLSGFTSFALRLRRRLLGG
jgi:peptidoglycan/xylan/chitin deacetylase (PgdA/CDA1 family)